jgi:hypothetical protein
MLNCRVEMQFDTGKKIGYLTLESFGKSKNMRLIAEPKGLIGIEKG